MRQLLFEVVTAFLGSGDIEAEGWGSNFKKRFVFSFLEHIKFECQEVLMGSHLTFFFYLL